MKKKKKDSALPVQGAWVQYLARLLDPAHCKEGPAHPDKQQKISVKIKK